MKSLFSLAVAALALGTFSSPVIAGADLSAATAQIVDWTITADTLEKRRKPRVPGGSGCDDPGDILEHPECRPTR